MCANLSLNTGAQQSSGLAILFTRISFVAFRRDGEKMNRAAVDERKISKSYTAIVELVVGALQNGSLVNRIQKSSLRVEHSLRKVHGFFSHPFTILTDR